MKQQEKTLLCVKSNGSSIYICGDTTNEEEMVALFNTTDELIEIVSEDALINEVINRG